MSLLLTRIGVENDQEVLSQVVTQSQYLFHVHAQVREAEAHNSRNLMSPPNVVSLPLTLTLLVVVQRENLVKDPDRLVIKRNRRTAPVHLRHNLKGQNILTVPTTTNPNAVIHIIHPASVDHITITIAAEKKALDHRDQPLATDDAILNPQIDVNGITTPDQHDAPRAGKTVIAAQLPQSRVRHHRSSTTSQPRRIEKPKYPLPVTENPAHLRLTQPVIRHGRNIRIANAIDRNPDANMILLGTRNTTIRDHRDIMINPYGTQMRRLIETVTLVVEIYVMKMRSRLQRFKQNENAIRSVGDSHVIGNRR